LIHVTLDFIPGNSVLAILELINHKIGLVANASPFQVSAGLVEPEFPAFILPVMDVAIFA
jgi:hypothetical protein